MSLSRIHLPASPQCKKEVSNFMRDFEVNEWRKWLEKPIVCVIVYADGLQESFTSCRSLLAASLHAFSVEKQSRH